MRALRFVSLLALLLVPALPLAGCGGSSYVVVTVDADGPLAASSLGVTVESDGQRAPGFTVHAPGAQVDLSRSPISFSLQFDRGRKGPVRIGVAVVGSQIAAGTGDGVITPEMVTSVRITLHVPPSGSDMMAAPDLAAPADLAAPRDLASPPDLLSADLLPRD